MKNQAGFVFIPVLVIAGMLAGVLFLTAPDSIKKEVAQKLHLEKK